MYYNYFKCPEDTMSLKNRRATMKMPSADIFYNYCKVSLLVNVIVQPEKTSKKNWNKILTSWEWGNRGTCWEMCLCNWL